MALTISQGLAISFPAIQKKKAENQWAESALMHEMDRQGGIKTKALGSTIEAPLDYQRNPGTAFLATELQAHSMNKTEVVTAASYTPAELVVPMVWSYRDEALNTEETQKVDLIDTIANNGLDSHDDFLEQYLFSTSTNGFLGLQTHITFAGTGSDGGIDSSVNTFWRNQTATYIDDTDIESAFTTVWNQCAKGSGAKLMPTLMVSDASTQSLFEGTQQANQRWVDTDELKAGFKILGFKTCRFVFSLYSGNFGATYFLNMKSFNLTVAKGFFRKKDEAAPIQNATGYVSRLYSALQTVVDNRSRLGIAAKTGAV